MTGWRHDQTGRIEWAGRPLTEAYAAICLVHGRGASAASILPLGLEIAGPEVALAAPQALHGTWYPASFLAPREVNEPGLSSGVELIDRTLREIRGVGIADERVLLAGFSQGACLALEALRLRPRRLGGVIAFSGGLPGPEGEWPEIDGLGGLPVFLGVAERDPHVPASRVEQTVELLRRSGAEVDLRTYPGTDHTVRPDELAAARDLATRLADPSRRESAVV